MNPHIIASDRPRDVLVEYYCSIFVPCLDLCRHPVAQQDAYLQKKFALYLFEIAVAPLSASQDRKPVAEADDTKRLKLHDIIPRSDREIRLRSLAAVLNLSKVRVPQKLFPIRLPVTRLTYQ